MYKLLYVDDEEIMRDCIFEAVKWEDYGILPVGAAENGTDALKIAMAEKPDIVVTDIIMPHMDGLELIRELRKVFPGIRIIILSGHNEFSYAQKAIEYKISSYILKPFVPQMLINAVTGAADELKGGHGGYCSSRFEAAPNNNYVLPIDKISELKPVILFGQADNLAETIDSIFDEVAGSNREILPASKLAAYSVVNFAARILEDIKLNNAVNGEMIKGINDAIKRAADINNIKSILDRCLREMSGQIKSSGSCKVKLIIEQSKNIIHSQYMKEDLCLNSVAAHVHLSPDYLRQLFKKATGESINAYLISVRMKRAYELLVTTEKKLHEIALEVGYNDEFYLSNVFKKYYGLRPSDVRNSASVSSEA